MKVHLSCVGCGRAVCDVESEERAGLAVACLCGADGPILRGDDGSFSAPATLVSILQMSTGPFVRPFRSWPRASIPHLEYFIGYSDHESALKTDLIQALRQLGFISQADCPGKRCRKAYEKGRERWQQYRQEVAQRELQEQERNYRIVEIGEP